MKNTFFTILIGTMMFFNSAHAEEKIDTVLQTKPGGLAERTLSVVENALGDQHGKRIVVDGCAALTEYLQKTNKPTVAISMPDWQVGDNNPCAVKEQNFYGYLGSSPFFLCVRTENKADAVSRLLNGTDIKIGYSNGSWIRKQTEKLVTELNTNIKAIPYKNSAAYRAALASGEIDFMVSSLAKDGEYCPIVLGPTLKDEAVVRGLDIAPNSEIAADFSYTTFLIGANIPLNKDLLNKILSSEAWKNRVDNRYTEYMTDVELSKQFEHANK